MFLCLIYVVFVVALQFSLTHRIFKSTPSPCRLSSLENYYSSNELLSVERSILACIAFRPLNLQNKTSSTPPAPAAQPLRVARSTSTKSASHIFQSAKLTERRNADKKRKKPTANIEMSDSWETSMPSATFSRVSSSSEVFLSFLVGHGGRLSACFECPSRLPSHRPPRPASPLADGPRPPLIIICLLAERESLRWLLGQRRSRCGGWPARSGGGSWKFYVNSTIIRSTFSYNIMRYSILNKNVQQESTNIWRAAMILMSIGASDWT